MGRTLARKDVVQERNDDSSSAENDRRNRLLDAGLELYSQRRYEEVSAHDIARHAGVSHGLMFHYFGSKRDFYGAVLDRLTEASLAWFETNTIEDPAQWLRAELDFLLDDIADKGELFTAIVHGSLGADVEVGRIIDRHRQNGVDRLTAKLAPDRMSPLLVATLYAFVEMVNVLGVQWLSTGRTIPKSHLRKLIIATLNAQLRTVAATDRKAKFDPERFAEA